MAYKSDWGRCERKKRYGSKKSALNDIKRIRKRSIMVHTPHVYKCDCCLKWHITKQAQVGKRGISI